LAAIGQKNRAPNLTEGAYADKHNRCVKWNTRSCNEPGAPASRRRRTGDRLPRIGAVWPLPPKPPSMPLSARKILDEIANIGSASLRYRANPVGTAIRYWKLYRRGLFSPHEIRFFSLLDPRLSPEALGRVVSKEALVRV